MRLFTLAAVSALCFGTGASAQTDYSAMIASDGLSGTAATLSALPTPTASDRFVLGGVNFLATVERTLQTRYTYGMAGEISAMLDVPLLRLPIPENLTPAQFTPDVIEALLLAAIADLDHALTALDAISDTDTVAARINTTDLWFDINMNMTRDPGEGLFEVLTGELDRNLPQDLAITVDFDTADAAWLSAYAHLLSGVAETLLAIDPTEAVTTVMTGTAQLDAVRDPNVPPGYLFFSTEDALWADALAIAIRAIEGQPDVDRSRAAHAHFLGMIADNRTFWARVVAETDRGAEWIPNKHQTSALPIDFPPETGPRWQAVLADAEALLQGDLLIPHWRLDPGAGLNLSKMMQDPPVLDIIGIIQGHTVAPYAERGRRIDNRNLRDFEQLIGGDAPLFMVLLN